MIRRRTRKGGKVSYLVSVGDSPTKSFTRWEDAKEYEGQLERGRKRERAGLETEQKPNIRFKELVELWRGNFAPSAWREDMMSYATARWGDVRVRDIEPELLGAWVATMTGRKGKPLAEKTKAHVLETMRQALNAGVEWEYLKRSPARPRAFKAPTSRKSRVRPIMPFETWDEVLFVADAAAGIWAPSGPLIRFVCSTGLRPIEWRELRWSDIDLNERILRTGSKTRAGERTVPLSDNALAALNELPRGLGATFVFQGRRTPQLGYKNWRAKTWKWALQSAGFAHRTPYEMRHTFATLALDQGAAIDDVAKVMGHEDISVAYDYYRKWTKNAADRLRGTLNLIAATKPESEAESL